MEECATCWAAWKVVILALLFLLNVSLATVGWRLKRYVARMRKNDIIVELHEGDGRGKNSLKTPHLLKSLDAHIMKTSKSIAKAVSSRVVPDVRLPRREGGLTMMSPTKKPRRMRNGKDWEINPRDVKLVERLASGSFGVVYLAEWCGLSVAVKKPLKDLPAEALEKFTVEVDLMIHLHHPNIVMCLGASLERGNMLLVLEYLEKGSLHDFLGSKEAETVLKYNKVLKFNIDIARGMRYLHHRANIIQRDLKTRNLLLDNSFNVKICDFGLSRYHARDDNSMTACGTPYWAAPEVILGETYNRKVDVFSFGIVMWEIITRDEPYDGRPGLDIAFAVAQTGLRPKIPPYCPEDYLKLMTQCWVHDPHLRPGFTEILERLHEMARNHRETIAAT